jgi:hypothetical protein
MDADLMIGPSSTAPFANSGTFAAASAGRIAAATTAAPPIDAMKSLLFM